MLKEMMNKKLNDYTGKETMVYAGLFMAATCLFSGVIYGAIWFGDVITTKREEKKEKENN